MLRYIVASVAALLLVVTAAFAAPVVNSDGTLPDPKITPGAWRTTDASVVCDKSHSTKEIRSGLKQSVHEQAYTLYGFHSHRDKWCNTEQKCEVDHLISLELGGSNEIQNLWPQPFEDNAWNAHVKDKLENELHKRVCSGRMSLVTAQTMIRTDWVAAYKKIIGPEPE